MDIKLRLSVVHFLLRGTSYLHIESKYVKLTLVLVHVSFYSSRSFICHFEPLGGDIYSSVVRSCRAKL